MANNQWKSFQSPPNLLNPDASSSIFDFKSLSLQGSGLPSTFRSITGAGANSGGSSSSSHSSYNHLNMSLFPGKNNDLHGNSSVFSSGYNSSTASVPPHLNYNNLFSAGNANNNNNSNNMANNRSVKYVFTILKKK